MGIDQLLCSRKTKVRWVQVTVGVFNDGDQEHAMLKSGIYIGDVTQIIVDGFLDHAVELAMSGSVETIWESLEGGC